MPEFRRACRAQAEDYFRHLRCGPSLEHFEHFQEICSISSFLECPWTHDF